MRGDLRGVADRIIARCQILANFTEEPGQIRRTFLSPAMRDCMQTVQGWMEAAGMTVFVDAAGNVRGRYAAAGSPAMCLMVGSHLDTVPNSGAFDGVLGVIVGLALVEELNGGRLPVTIELVAFSEEEGVRYKLPFIGSRALVGRLDGDALKTADDDGITVAEAITSFGLDASRLGETVLGDDVAAFLEFHIEQGVTLESEGMSLGVVQAIAGQSRAEITFTGRARHAGTTPMHLRNDAVAGAAAWVCEVERVALSTAGLVATVGDLRTHPGAGNVVAGQLKASLDVRHGDDAVRHRAVDHLLEQASSIAKRRGLAVDVHMQMDQAAVAMNAQLCALATDAIRSTGVVPLAMVSGAGHDAMIVAERIPATMIFLRSPGGISHHPDESVRAEDVENAVAAGLEFVHRFAASYTHETSMPHA